MYVEEKAHAYTEKPYLFILMFLFILIPVPVGPRTSRGEPLNPAGIRVGGDGGRRTERLLQYAAGCLAAQAGRRVGLSLHTRAACTFGVHVRSASLPTESRLMRVQARQ